MKHFFLFFILTGVSTFAWAQDDKQEVKIARDTVFVDGKACLKISGDVNNVTYSDLEGNEIVYLKFVRPPNKKLFTQVTFPEQRRSLTSQTYIFTKKLLVNKLLADGTLSDCKLNEEKIDRFIMKYHEDVDDGDDD